MTFIFTQLLLAQLIGSWKFNKQRFPLPWGLQLQLTRSLTVYRQKEVENYHVYLVILITVVYTNNLRKPALMLLFCFSFFNKVSTGKKAAHNDAGAPTVSQVLPWSCKLSI